MRSWKRVYETIASGSMAMDRPSPASNGFNSCLGSLAISDFRRIARQIHEIADIKSHYNILEIGCGNGLLLSEVSNVGGGRFFGVDIAEGMIELAKSHFPDSTKYIFETHDARKIPFGDTRFDVIFLHSVVQYFPNRRYLKSVIKSSAGRLKSGGRLLMLDVPDRNKRFTYRKARREVKEKRLHILGPLRHLYVSRKFIIRQAENLGFTKWKFFEHAARNYTNSAFRFNVVLYVGT